MKVTSCISRYELRAPAMPAAAQVRKLASSRRAAHRCCAVSSRQALEMSLQASAAKPQAVSSAALPPVISASYRSADDIAVELQQQLQQHPQALVKGVEPDMYSALRKVTSSMELKVQYQARAKMLVVKPLDAVLPRRQRLPGTVFVVSGGPEDQVAVDQVMVAAEHMGCYVISKPNFSTRNLPKLLEQAEGLLAADVVVVIAGVDSVLPNVLSGMIDAPIIAVPTSTDSTLQGVGSLITAVSNCPLGVSVVGLDETISAAVMSAKILRVAAARVDKLQAAAVSAAQQEAPVHGSLNGQFNNILPGFAPVQLEVPAQPAAL